MRVLKDDVFSRRPQANQQQRRRSGVMAFVFILISGALLVLSRIEHPAVNQMRLQIAELLAPALQVITLPLAPIRRMTQELAAYTAGTDQAAQLRDENQRLKGWEARARELERRLGDLGALANVVEEPGLKFATGRVIADANGPFARSVLLSAGRQNGIRSGYPVISADGLVGRVLETGQRSARLLLLTDLNSRIPILVGESGIRGVLIGDNSGRPRIVHLPANVEIASGDAVVTSGIGGIFPRGLRIGAVEDDGSHFRVIPHSRLDDLDYVSVLFFDSPALELADEDHRPSTQQTRRDLARRANPAAPTEK